MTYDEEAHKRKLLSLCKKRGFPLSSAQAERLIAILDTQDLKDLTTLKKVIDILLSKDPGPTDPS